MNTTTVGVDLAKMLFSICVVDAVGHVLRRLELDREGLASWLAQLPAGTVVAMEACSGAHYWARHCRDWGLVPRLIAAQFVKPFRKSLAAKNDRNDAEAIATAARQGNMRFVPIKLIDQQARLSWHRVREGYKVESLAIANRLRGLLAEFGIVVANSDAALRRMLADLDEAQLPSEFKQLLCGLQAHWAQVREALDACTVRIEAHARDDAQCTRARAIIFRSDRGRRPRRQSWHGPGFPQRSATGRVAGFGAEPTFHRWPRTAGHDQLSRGCVLAHVADSGCAQQPAARQGDPCRKIHARANLDTSDGLSDSVWQSAGSHRQQTCAATMGNAGTR